MSLLLIGTIAAVIVLLSLPALFGMFVGSCSGRKISYLKSSLWVQGMLMLSAMAHYGLNYAGIFKGVGFAGEAAHLLLQWFVFVAVGTLACMHYTDKATQSSRSWGYGIAAVLLMAASLGTTVYYCLYPAAGLLDVGWSLVFSMATPVTLFLMGLGAWNGACGYRSLAQHMMVSLALPAAAMFVLWTLTFGMVAVYAWGILIALLFLSGAGHSPSGSGPLTSTEIGPVFRPPVQPVQGPADLWGHQPVPEPAPLPQYPPLPAPPAPPQGYGITYGPPPLV